MEFTRLAVQPDPQSSGTCVRILPFQPDLSWRNPRVKAAMFDSALPGWTRGWTGSA